jgi:hypothetical protein
MTFACLLRATKPMAIGFIMGLNLRRQRLFWGLRSLSLILVDELDIDSYI